MINLLEAFKDMTYRVGKVEIVISVFGFQKAVDEVLHNRLLHKVGSKVFAWIEDQLTNRKQKMKAIGQVQVGK